MEENKDPKKPMFVRFRRYPSFEERTKGMNTEEIQKYINFCSSVTDLFLDKQKKKEEDAKPD